MQDHTLNGLTVMFFGSMIANLLVHWFVVCPALYKDGARLPTGLLPWRIFTELNRYRDILRAHSDSLSPYYIILLFRWFNAALGGAVGLWWLWLLNNPPT